MDNPVFKAQARSYGKLHEASKEVGRKEMLDKINPVFDKMLAALKGLYDPSYEGPGITPHHRWVIEIIKEAEELGI